MSILAGDNSKTWIGVIAVTAIAGVLYFLTAARDIVVGDSPELIMAAVTLGVAHAPGYPLFTMLGHLFSLLPFGSIPFRVNLLSVVCDTLTIGVVYFSAFRLTRSQLAAAVAALLLAVNPIFWEWSLAAEVFPLNNLLAAVLILLLVAWHQHPERSAFLIAAFFVAGLALTNHQTIVLLGPAFCFILWRRRLFLLARPSLLAIGVAAFVVGLLPYLYVPWAAAHHPVHNWGDVSSFHDLLRLIARRSYGSKLVTTPGYTGGPPWDRLAALFVSFGPVAGLLTVLGAIQAFRRTRWYFWFSLVAFVFTGPFFVWITDLNLSAAPSALFVLQRFFLLSHIVLAPLIGFGVLALAQFVARSTSATALGALCIVAACLVAAAIMAATNYRRIDQSQNLIARRFAQDVFNTTPPGSVLLVNGDGLAFPLMYLQQVEHIGNETTLVVVPLLLGDWYVRQLREQHPELVVPFDRYDPQSNNMKILVEANSSRTIAIAGAIGNDHSLDLDFWPYQQGLLIKVMPKSQDVPLDTLLAQNEQLLSRCHPPAPGSVRANTFEADILNVYAYPAFTIAATCERAGLKAEARTWYERALAINPQFSQARQALARVEH
ncbi:MAG: hypothetical protein DME41_10770 [Verrucomicrobia bacterium]|nr:MAG: hypothetical protein DME41_10770 [Verrucomicrobiota bacterium]